MTLSIEKASGLNSPDPIAEFFMAWRAGIGEGIDQVVVSGDAAAVLRRACELAIGENGIG